MLSVLVGWASLISIWHKVPYNWHQILASVAWLVLVCWIVNKLTSHFLNIPANKESFLITALILCLILPAPASTKDFAIVGVIAFFAIISKYVITFQKSHIFNPAAFGAFVAGRFFNYFPSWWVGTKFLTPIVVVGGILVLRKMKRFTMAALFVTVFLLYLIYGTSLGGSTHFLWLELISTQLLFFAIVMLTEPLTSPTTLSKYIPYTVLVAVLYSATKYKIHFAPEEALLVGNLFTFMFARNRRYAVKFLRKIEEANGIYSYLFSMPKGFKFQAGQYMEWTLEQSKTDRRGNRRYLTISSSPNEPGLMFTIKKPSPASAFKQKLDELKPGQTMLASHLAGSFTLPKDSNKKLAFLAGGIGVTPFRSMISEIMQTKQNRDAVLVYSASSEAELAFKNHFKKAEAVGLRTEYLTNSLLDETRLKQLVPDFKDRRIYLSGPYGFVQAVQMALLKLGANPSEVVTDYFPGYGA
jgi:ferredoxin-NADP reductase/Na+-translocating ferredoxin:NAD+ oxidoreductase RnfD subunit